MAELRKAGATVKVDDQNAGKRVVAVDLAGCTVPITDATVAHLKGLTRVRTLDL